MVEYRINLDEMEVRMGLGVHPHERAAPQRVKLSVAMICQYFTRPTDRIDAVVDYDMLRDGIRKLVESRHFALQEVLCEEIADLALRDDRVVQVMVRSTKPDIFPDARVGCEITRTRQDN
jgi:7,8-dihydroneopterin aldolase/epimerase/oxygenase